MHTYINKHTHTHSHAGDKIEKYRTFHTHTPVREVIIDYPVMLK